MTILPKRGRPKKETLPEHYVDNAKLYENLKKWIYAKREAVAEGKEPPRLPDAIGKDIVAIAQRFATRKNFSMYPFVDDMVSDAVENCIRYIDNFDPDNYDNPFSYFTQTTYYAFIRRIQKEKRVLYVKYKMMDNNTVVSGNYGDNEYYDSSDHAGTPKTEYGNQDVKRHFIENFEANIKKKDKGNED